MIAAPLRLLTASDHAEVAERAWLNVLPHSFEYPPLLVLASFADLDALAPDALEHRAQVQFTLSDTVREFVRSAATTLRNLPRASDTVLDAARVPFGLVDWPSTIARRLSQGGDPGSFVLRQTNVHFDTPANRLLKYLLAEVARIGHAAAGDATGAWQIVAASIATLAERLMRDPSLATVPAQPSRLGALAAYSARVPGYSHIARTYQLHAALFGRGDRQTLLDLFSERLLMPSAEDRVFELLVLFRLIDHLERQGFRRRALQLIGRGSGPTFTFERESTTVTIHFQGVHHEAASASIYRRFANAGGLGGAIRRPDISVHMKTANTPPRTMLIEAKCSTVLDYHRDGAFQLVAYFADFRLYEDPVPPTLVLVVHSGGGRYPAWPGPAVSHPFVGYVADLAGLSETLEHVLG